MRTCTAIAALMLLVSSVLAEDQQQTPRESFEAFVAAVLDEEMTAEDRRAVFERYFDFDTWLQDRAAEEGKVHTDDETAELRQQWFELFESTQFRDSYRRRNVRVLKEPAADRARGRAELVIAMQGPELEDEQFRVRMTLSEDGTYWRWYSIPRIEEDVPTLTPEQRVKRIEEAMQLITEKRALLDAQEKALREELTRLRSELAEADAGKSDYASPISVVESAWRAVEKGDADALLDCHTTRRVSESNLEDLKTKLEKTRVRLMKWEVLDSTIDEQNPARADVRVRLTLQQTGEPDRRVVTVPVVRDGKEWKIDEAP